MKQEIGRDGHPLPPWPIPSEGIMLRFTCSAYPNGCLGFVQFPAPPDMVLPAVGQCNMDAFVEDDLDERVEWHLLTLGWRRVGGRWVCWHHPVDKWT